MTRDELATELINTCAVYTMNGGRGMCLGVNSVADYILAREQSLQSRVDELEERIRREVTCNNAAQSKIDKAVECLEATKKEGKHTIKEWQEIDKALSILKGEGSSDDKK